MNFILAFLLILVYYALVTFVSITWKWFAIVVIIINNAIIVNIGLGVFNLIPIPPLDGSKVFRRFLPYSANEWLDRNMQIIYIIFMVLWITGALSLIVAPIINLITNGLLWIVLIMGIESSCDETSVAIVKNGRIILSNVINSQIDIHTKFGGVVPEIASRCHVEVINQVMKKSLEDANCSLSDIDAIAVTQGPGLVGALLVGVSYAKALSFSIR